MTPGILLGLTGAAGAGKDTCALLLRQHGFRSIAFADAVRAEIAEAWRIDPRMLTERDTKEWPLPALAIGNCTDRAFVHLCTETDMDPGEPRSARWVMQRWGTEYRRATYALYWVDKVHHWVRQQRDAGARRLVITDVRFENEAELVRYLRGQVVRVHRPSLPALLQATAAHASERPLVTTEVVHNDGDIEHLRAELMRVVHRFAPAVTTPWYPPEEAHG